MPRRLFVNRLRELQTLQSMWERDTADLLVLYGRRRVGKTELLRAPAKTPAVATPAGA